MYEIEGNMFETIKKMLQDTYIKLMPSGMCLVVVTDDEIEVWARKESDIDIHAIHAELTMVKIMWEAYEKESVNWVKATLRYSRYTVFVMPTIVDHDTPRDCIFGISISPDPKTVLSIYDFSRLIEEMVGTVRSLGVIWLRSRYWKFSRDTE